ncbi:MAG TPA: hypothetical protein VGX21_08305 [Methylomirabilota bacterium]|nr:hypothetical protein [Methylomirabilota bacterium]
MTLAAWLPFAVVYLVTLAAAALGAVINADEWAQKMMDRLGVAGADWEKGMQGARGTIVSRGRASAKKWAANVQAAIAGGTFEKGLARVTDDDIISGAMAAGGGKLVAGVTQRAEKVRKAIATLQPKVAALSARLAAMPTDTEQQAEQKAVEAIRGMRAIGKELAGLTR